jgi:hypothetical protein
MAIAKKIVVLLTLALMLGLIAHALPTSHQEHDELDCAACVLLASFVLLVLSALLSYIKIPGSKTNYVGNVDALRLYFHYPKRGPPVTL